ncbi:MAG: hypothetical protein WC211_00240 [Dehalococcoidia bacterium]
MPRNVLIFAVVVAVALIGGGAYLGLSIGSDEAFHASAPEAGGRILDAFTQQGSATPVASGAPAQPSPSAAASVSATPVGSEPSRAASTPAPARGAPSGFIVFLDDEDPAGRRVAVVSRDDPGGARDVTGTRCARVYVAGGAGVCLAERGVSSFQNVSVLLDARLQPTGEFPFPGIPSRARVAGDGRYASGTVFVSGHTYAIGGAFSTRTVVIDVASKQPILDLEQLVFTRDGKPFRQPDFNLWGVTFAADSNRFYATLGTNTSWHIIEGDLAAKTARVIFDTGECPSLSPDGTRLAFKRRNADGTWRLAVLDLRTLTHRLVESETRNFDEQAEWLDNDRLIYGMPATSDGRRWDVWMVPADGSSSPQLLIPHASSPSVVRGTLAR